MKVCSCECIKSFVDNADVERLGSPLSRGLPARGGKKKHTQILFRKMTARIGAYCHVPPFKPAIIFATV